jgi:hypothetical protein
LQSSATVQRIRRHLTYANVMSSIAVFLVLGGGAAYAAKKISTKKIDSGQLKGSSVTTAKIKRGAVTASKIRKGALKANKISKGAVTNAKLANGAVTLEKLVPGFVAPAAEKLSHAADISSAGTVLAGSVGIAQANVSHPKPGFYCFSGLSPAPVGGVATVDYSESGESIVAQFDTGPGPGTICPAGTQAFVNTRLISLSSPTKPGEPYELKAPAADGGFFVVLY